MYKAAGAHLTQQENQAHRWKVPPLPQASSGVCGPWLTTHSWTFSLCGEINTKVSRTANELRRNSLQFLQSLPHQSQELTIFRQFFRPFSALLRGGSLTGLPLSALGLLNAASFSFCLDIGQQLSPFLRSTSFRTGAGMGGNLVQPLLGKAEVPGGGAAESSQTLSCVLCNFSTWALLCDFLSEKIKDLDHSLMFSYSDIQHEICTMTI